MKMTNIVNLTIAFVGVGYEPLANQLEKEGFSVVNLPMTHFPIKSLKSVDIVHGFYFHSVWPWMIKAKLLKKRTVCHWLGSDVLLARKNLLRKLQVKLTSIFVDEMLVVSERIQKELEELRIESKIVSLVPPIKTDPKFPLGNDILVYARPKKEKLYGLDIVLSIARELEMINFHVVGIKKEELNEQYKYNLPSNIIWHGYVDLNTIWPKVKILLRMTEHDGFPRMIFEAFSRGKYVIHNYPLPGVEYCETIDDAKSAIEKLIEKEEQNKKGLKLMEEKYTFEGYVKRVKQIYLDISK